MDRRRISPHRTGDRRCFPLALLGACLIAWSAPGAATPSVLDDRAGDLATAGDYTFEIVDLMDGNEGAIDARDGSRKVPYLFLTPRVATILENVFGDDAAIVDGATAEHDEQSATSPVAENVESPVSSDTPAFDHSAILPRFQRQMYRTDI